MQTIGQRLRATREQRKATLSQAAEATRVKSTQLEMIEADQFDKLGAPIYAKGFLRLYGEFLGLDPEALVRAYLEVHGPQRPVISHETAPKVVGRRTPLSRDLAPETDLGEQPDGYGGPQGRRGRQGGDAAAAGRSPRMTIGEFLDRRDVRVAFRAAGFTLLAVLAIWLAFEGIRALARFVPTGVTTETPTGIATVIEEPPAPFLDPQSVRTPSVVPRRP